MSVGYPERYTEESPARLALAAWTEVDASTMAKRKGGTNGRACRGSMRRLPAARRRCIQG